MKQISTIITFFIIGLSSLTGQNFEARLTSGIGVSSANFYSDTDWHQYDKHQKMVSIGADINYFFKSKNNLGFYVGSGVGYKQNDYLYLLKSDMFDYNIRNVKFKQQHIDIPLRIGTELKLFGSNSIGFEYEVQYNQAIKADFSEDSENLFAIHKSLEYSYSLESRTNSFFSQQIALFLKTQIGNNLFLFSSLNYEIRPITGAYDIVSFQNQTLTDVETGVQQSNVTNRETNNREIGDNLVTVKLGITKTF